MSDLGRKSKKDRNKARRSSSLLSKIMGFMIILAMLQISVFGILMVMNGGFSQIKRYSYNMILEKTENRRNYVENIFNQKTALVYETANEINEIAAGLLREEGVTAAAIQTDKELDRLILASCADSLISLLRRDMVNDVFLVLDSGALYDTDDQSLRPGIYLRDTDVDENSIFDNKDIFMDVGSSETARSYGLPLDSGWSLFFDMTDIESGRNDYYYEPLATYAENAHTPLYNLGYWSGLTSISDLQQGSIKYSLPLVAEDGTVYGILGIGLLEKTIQQIIPTNDFTNASACYILATDPEGNGQYRQQLHRGASYGRLVGYDRTVSAKGSIEHNLYDFTIEGGPAAVGSIQRLNIYKSGSPYRNRNWVLISVADQDEVLSTYYVLIRMISISMVIAFAVSVIFSIFVARRFSQPVVKMMGTLNSSRSHHDIVQFTSSGISEMDALGAAIVRLQVNAAEYASRVSRIISMSGSGIGVFMYDCSSGSVFVGESLIKLLKFTDLPGRDVTISAQNFKKQLEAVDKENVIMNLPIFEEEENTDTHESDGCEVQYTDVEGNVIWLKFSLTRDDTNVMGLVQDITNTVEEKREVARAKDDEYTERLLEANAALRTAYEAAIQANHAKTDFLSRMSHDIRTPMNAIIGMTAIAENHLDDPARLSDCFSKISASSQFLLALINEVLDMSKIEAGKLVLTKENINILELVDNLIEMIRPSVKQKRHELVIQIDEMTHENIIGDSLRIQQVFMNFMSNAVKYTPEGGRLEFRLSEKAISQKGVGCYEFVFADNGKGMSPEFLEKLFLPFEREEDERVSKEQGTGLGMTIAYNIVKMMNGDVKVESEVGKGSTFTVTLYLSLDDKESISLAELEGSRALIVDDDHREGENVCAMLKSIGMRGEWVATGRAAVEKIEKARKKKDDFRAVILDWKMPEMDGLETVRMIRDRIDDKILIIIYSAYDWAEIEQEARDAGVDAFISKPMFRPKLVAVMKSLLGQSQGRTLDTIKENDYSGYRVLLVDDNELNREIAVEILGMLKLEVETAENGREAVEKFEAAEPGYYSMIFMDIQMPVMNGYEATRTIRALPREDAAHIPIVAMTANAFAEDVRDAEKAGMNEHIAKPLDPDRLVKSLNRWVIKEQQEK